MTNLRVAPFAPNSLLWFSLLALAVGAGSFGVASQELVYPRLAAAALLVLLLTSIAVRVAPALKRAGRWPFALEIAALFVFSCLIAAASGGVRSTFLTLFLLPLTGAAICLTRPAFATAAALAVVAYTILGVLTPGVDIISSTFVIHLIGTIAPILVASAAIAVLTSEMRSAEQQIRDLSSSDALTGLHNLRSFEERLQNEHRKAERLGMVYSVAKVGIDNLAQTNQSAGLEVGNQMVVAVSAAISRSIRTSDIAARIGGDEFAVLLSAADPATAATIGQRIRNNVYAGTISAGNRLLRANVSLGIASFPKDCAAWKDLTQFAGERMQQDRQQRTGK